MGVIKTKKIKVPTARLNELAVAFGCTTTKVYNALAFRSNSESAEQIRQSALKDYNGLLVTEVKVI